MAEPVPEYSDLHRLVDRLTPDQARAVRAVVLQMVPVDQQEGPTPDVPIRRLSFAGVGHAEPDLSERSTEILRTELGDPDR